MFTAGLLPRQMQVGPVLLDLFHRDARVGKAWLHLHPREFGLLWRLAESPGTRLSRSTLLREVWRLDHDPETNTLEVHVFRLRRKLSVHGVRDLVLTDPTGGYRLDAKVSALLDDGTFRELLDSPALIGNGGTTE